MNIIQQIGLIYIAVVKGMSGCENLLRGDDPNNRLPTKTQMQVLGQVTAADILTPMEKDIESQIDQLKAVIGVGKRMVIMCTNTTSEVCSSAEKAGLRKNCQDLEKLEEIKKDCQKTAEAGNEFD